MSKYNASQISVLKGLEAVRKNPGMYIGSLSSQGLHHLLWEILDNSCDEAMGGFCTEVSIIVDKDGETITVEDNGRGIPVDTHPIEKRSALEVVMTTLHAGGKFEEAGGSYTSSGGLHGVGASCVNALSDQMYVEVCRDGVVWKQTYSAGRTTSKVKKVGKCRKTKTGTKSSWHPDKNIFKNVKVDDNLIVRRIREMAFLNRGLKINYKNIATKFEESFCFDGGISDYVKYLCDGKDEVYPSQPLFGEGKSSLTSRPGDCEVQIALAYSGEDDETILSFCNNINTGDGGTHVTGFKNAYTRVINVLARQHGLLKESANNLSGDDVREGLMAVVSVRFARPEFISQTKSKLGTTEIESVVSTIASQLLSGYFDKNSGVLKKIVNRALVAQQARAAAKKQSDLVKKKGFLGKNNRMPGKLYDCDSEKRDLRELFIVEGDSAGGSGKDGRDPETQAILPIRGKIINAEKNDISTLLKNKEVQSLIIAIGTGIKDDFDFKKLRYNKVIVMCDADEDGNHIATLLLTFFYRYMRPLVADGYIYLAQPPLFCVDNGKRKVYCWSEAEMQSQVKKLGKCKVVRFKGLGEMDAEQLAETTMHPNGRRLIRLQIDDQGETEHMVSVLMGSNAQLRKEHIVNQVNSVVKK
ncbi:MAG: DNA gyrase subunit B [Crenarchaeota archaeon]|nr:MAG: DNA gyrase subunit B [Thermoproteota archaeon]